MATLLVTKKMPAALAARVEDSVAGRRAQPGARLAPRAMALLRLGGFSAVAGLAVWAASSFWAARQETLALRAELLARVRSEAAELGPVDRQLPERVRPLLARLAGPWEGDAFDAELRGAGRLARVLERPTVYVRGPITSFSSRSGVDESAAASHVDAFVVCLLDPPLERTERQVAPRARAALRSGSEARRRVAHVGRLHDALVALAYLEPGWEARIAEARTRRQLARLREAFDAAPWVEGRRAARAELLLVVMDEPGDASVPAELDGERPHEVRVGLVELASGRTLLLARRPVDPRWASAETRATLAAGVDACSLALDVTAAAATTGG